MKPYYYHLDEERRVLASVDVWEDDVNEYGDWLVTRVRTTPNGRHEGRASEVLREVCDDADHEGVTLWLQIQPDEDCPMTAVELEAWYEKFGFKSEPFPLMIRKPTSPDVV